MFIRTLFDKYQKYLLAFANTKYGRMYLELEKWAKVKHNYKIVKITPDSVHWWTGEYSKKGRRIYQAVFFPKSQYLKKFDLALTGLDIASRNIKKILYPDLVIPHYAGLTTVNWLPLVMYNSLTSYPDAHAESTSVDGHVGMDYVAHNGPNWATIKAAAGTTAVDNETSGGIYMQCDYAGDDNCYLNFYRPITLFDTSDLTASASVISATLSFYGALKTNTNSYTPSINVFSSVPADNTALAAGDYDSLGTTALSNTSIAYADWSTTGYNDFALNTSGLDSISKIGITKLSYRDVTYDTGAGTPTWAAEAYFQVYTYFADNGSNKPKLVVNYILPKSPLPCFRKS